MPTRLVNDISPYSRVAIALVPFLAALVLRLILGKNRTTRILLSISTTWFAVNILLAPFSVEMRTELNHIIDRFR